MSWSKRGERPKQPGRYDVEFPNGVRATFEITRECSGLVVRASGTWLQCTELDDPSWNAVRWLRITDPPAEIEIIKNRFFICLFNGNPASGIFYVSGSALVARVLFATGVMSTMHQSDFLPCVTELKYWTGQ